MRGKVLILLRGVPGSGKSTLAKELGGEHFETDRYFFDENSEYRFDATKLKEAHQWCFDQVSNAMILNHTANLNERIVVSNTFTQEWEMEAYFKLAEEWQYQVFSIIVENRHGGQNQHGVPEDKVQAMRDRFTIKL
jgi:adenylate kinase family enzyme